jgi:hypothetical protein
MKQSRDELREFAGELSEVAHDHFKRKEADFKMALEKAQTVTDVLEAQEAALLGLFYAVHGRIPKVFTEECDLIIEGANKESARLKKLSKIFGRFG